ncbi:hypothetical protein KCU78_g23577, partial [Aureobasidium melanogenum]
EHNIIMVLPALDDAQGGIHHETALTACAVVAGNRWDGFLREQGTGSRVTTPRDGILKGKDYFFCLSGDAKAPRPEIEPIDVPRNALLLRSDIHTLFDQRRFAITLKPLPVASDSAATHGLAVHLFSPGLSEQFAKLYHGVALQPLYGVAPEYLFARFTWTVFAYSAQFLEQGTKRALYIVHDGETSDQEVNADQCMQLYLSCKSRSLS